eukprot:scaffold74044_cov32-Tisochrysis_lutea.AAC.4
MELSCLGKFLAAGHGLRFRTLSRCPICANPCSRASSGGIARFAGATGTPPIQHSGRNMLAT